MKNIISYLTPLGAELPVNQNSRLQAVGSTDRFILQYQSNVSQYAIWTIEELPYFTGNLTIDLYLLPLGTGTANFSCSVETITSTMDLTNEVNIVASNSNSINITNQNELTILSIKFNNSFQEGNYSRVFITRNAPDGCNSTINLLGAILYENNSNYDLTNFNSVEALSATVSNSIVNIGNNGVFNNSIINIISDNNYTDYGLQIERNTGVNGRSQISTRGTGGILISNQDSASIQIDSVYILNNGNVGVDKNIPLELLHLNGNIAIYGTYKDSVSQIAGTSYGIDLNSDQAINLSVTEDFENIKNSITVTDSKVGIGTMSPDATLHILNDGTPITLPVLAYSGSYGGINIKNNNGTRCAILSDYTSNNCSNIQFNTSYDNKATSIVVTVSCTGTLNFSETSPLNFVDGDFWIDSNQKTSMCYINGAIQSQEMTLFTNIQEIVASSYLTNPYEPAVANIVHLTLPANFFVNGKILKLSMAGYYGPGPDTTSNSPVTITGQATMTHNPAILEFAPSGITIQAGSVYGDINLNDNGVLGLHICHFTVDDNGNVTFGGAGFGYMPSSGSYANNTLTVNWNNSTGQIFPIATGVIISYTFTEIIKPPMSQYIKGLTLVDINNQPLAVGVDNLFTTANPTFMEPTGIDSARYFMMGSYLRPGNITKESQVIVNILTHPIFDITVDHAILTMMN